MKKKKNKQIKKPHIKTPLRRVVRCAAAAALLKRPLLRARPKLMHYGGAARAQRSSPHNKGKITHIEHRTSFVWSLRSDLFRKNMRLFLHTVLLK